MKIAYVFHADASDPSVQSGSPTSVLHELERVGTEVHRIFPIAVPATGAEFAKKVGYRLLGKFHRHDRDVNYAESIAAEFAARTVGVDFDVVLSPGSEDITHLNTPAPITFFADATFANLVDYYWDFSGLSAEYLRKGHTQEAAALGRAALAVYTSEWAARSAIEDYGMDPARIAIIPFGANRGADNDRATVERWIESRPRDHLRLLFVGRHWDRKGGDTVIATALTLIGHGHPLTLDIVGCEVPAQYRHLPWIRAHGLLHQCKPADRAQLDRLYSEAHFIFVPSKAEAFGIIFAEGNAYGLPAIATRTGGITGAVRDGYNGRLLPADAKPADFADVIVACFSDGARYRQLCHQAFDEFEQRLNWRAFVRKYLDAVEDKVLSAPRTLKPVA